MMKQTIYLVDSENVSDAWVQLVPRLKWRDMVVVFHTRNSPHFTADNASLISQKKHITWEKCFTGTNGLDFQLVTRLGYLICKKPRATFVIVSNDTGFDAAIKFWVQEGMDVMRIRGASCSEDAPLAEMQEKIVLEDAPDKQLRGKYYKKKRRGNHAKGNFNQGGQKDVKGQGQMESRLSVGEVNALVSQDSQKDAVGQGNANAQKGAAGQGNANAQKGAAGQGNANAQKGTTQGNANAQRGAAGQGNANAQKGAAGQGNSGMQRDEKDQASQSGQGSANTQKDGGSQGNANAQKDSGGQGNANAQKDGGGQGNANAQKDGGSQNPVATVLGICRSISLNRHELIHESLVALLGAEDGREVYCFLKENQDFQEKLRKIYLTDRKDRVDNYLKVVFEYNQEELTEMDAIKGIINTHTASDRDGIFRAMTETFGNKNGAAYYGILKSHVRVLKKL